MFSVSAASADLFDDSRQLGARSIPTPVRYWWADRRHLQGQDPTGKDLLQIDAVRPCRRRTRKVEQTRRTEPLPSTDHCFSIFVSTMIFFHRTFSAFTNSENA